MKTGESFWWEYYGSGLIGNKHPGIRRFKWKSLWMIAVLIWCVVITLWLIFK